jgi:prophage regulatory protein
MPRDINSLTQHSIDSTLLRRPKVEAMIGLKRAAIYVRIAAGLLPQPVKIGSRVSGWPAREITAVNEAIIAGKTDAEIKTLVRDLVRQRTGGEER